MRKILINYPKRQVGNKMYGGESSHLPLKINTAGVIQQFLLLLYSYYQLQFQILVLQSRSFLKISSMFTQGQPCTCCLYASGIIFFLFFILQLFLIQKKQQKI